MISNDTYWEVLSRISPDQRRFLRARKKGLIGGSERRLLIREEIPYNPLEIMREASRLAVESKFPNADEWSISEEGAHLGNINSPQNIFSVRRSAGTDGDKLCALEVLAQVCEYVKSRS